VLAVTRVMLTDFRNYARAELEARPGPVVLTGPNGAGKTNVLEAISYLSPGRGLRRARLGDVARHGGGGGWAVAASLTGAGEAGEDDIRLGTGCAPAAGGPDGASNNGRRLVRINGEPAAGPAALAEWLRLVWLTPAMERLFTEGASGRRRFLDRLVLGFDADHGRRAARYERALRERARLLREGPADDAWLTALEARLAEDGVALAAARLDVIARLRGALEAGVGPFPRATIAAVGEVESWLRDGPALEAEARLRERLAASRRQDGESGKTAVGPHRSDLSVRHVEKGLPAALCSTGEQKALLIAIVLADARLQAAHAGSAPVLLLDEVTAHLDGARRAALFEEILALGAQAWLTGADRAPFGGLAGAAQFLTIDEGRIDPAR
jgi:DNA replication and repair protein RecF